MVEEGTPAPKGGRRGQLYSVPRESLSKSILLGAGRFMVRAV